MVKEFMSRFNHDLHISRSGTFYRFLLVTAAVALLVILLPYDGSGLYEYNVGKPWFNNTVIANEDFPLLKSDSVIKYEQQKAREAYKPVYEKDPNVSSLQTGNFAHQFNSAKGVTIPLSYRSYVISRLEAVYDAGVMSAADYDREVKEKRKSITISVKNSGSQQMLDQVFTPKTAYEFLITSTDSTRYQRSVLQKLDLANYVRTNLTYDKVRSESQLQALEQSVSRYNGIIQSGQEIVHRGQIVDEETALALRSLELHHNREKDTTSEIITQRLGQIMFMLIVVTCMFFYLRQFRPDYLCNFRTMVFIVMMVFCFPALTYVLQKTDIEPYIIPYCMLPIFLRVFTDSRTAFTLHIATILLSAIAVSRQFEFIFIEVSAGLVAIFSIKQMSSRSDFFQTVMLVTLSTLVCCLCFDLNNKSFFNSNTLNYDSYLLILGSGVLLMVSYLLLFPFERLFRFTSTVTMVELSNTNNEILRRLSEEAPGTFQHSMQVANLSSDVARKIGADSQLVRTGALYHDIGKVDSPVYFTENQSGQSPHDNLSYSHSAQIIISHVRKGLELAERYKLPPVIREFIATHHGTGKVRYFLTQQMNAHPNEEVDEHLFTYPGPNPHTVEQAILMMADSVEAASRSLTEHTDENVSQLVDRIVGYQVSEGFFNHCPITFEDISIAKQVMKDKLKIIYHTRISYPELNKEAKEETTETKS